MIVVFTVLLFLLGVAKFLFDRRARSLAKKYSRVATEADRLVHDSLFRQGNASRPDPYQAAKRQFRLGVLAQERDRLERRHFTWQRLADRTGNALRSLRSWKGRKLPYTFGVVDVSLVLYTIDRFGVGDYVRPEYLWEMVQTLIAQ